MTSQRPVGDDFLAQLKGRLSDSIGEQERLVSEIAELTNKREVLARQIASLQTLLDIEGGEDLAGLPASSSVPPSPPSVGSLPERSARARTATADDVVDLLAREGTSMHYKDIHAAIVERGIPIGGRGNADTLLSRYFKDERLERVARGTYALVDQKGRTR